MHESFSPLLLTSRKLYLVSGYFIFLLSQSILCGYNKIPETTHTTGWFRSQFQRLRVQHWAAPFSWPLVRVFCFITWCKRPALTFNFFFFKKVVKLILFGQQKDAEREREAERKICPWVHSPDVRNSWGWACIFETGTIYIPVQKRMGATGLPPLPMLCLRTAVSLNPGTHLPG